MPVGIPFYMESRPDGFFSHEIATDRKDFSKVSLDCLHYMLYNTKEFRRPDGEVYHMQTVITGEHVVTVGSKKYRVDGYIKTPDQDYFIEFYGCR